MILANGCNITKSEKFKGVWILSVPTISIYLWFYTFYKYIIIIFIDLFSFKLQKWFSQEQWEMFLQCAMINMNGRQNKYWTVSPLRPKSGSNIAKLLLHMRFLFLPFTLS